MSAVAINNIATTTTTDPSIESLEKEIQSIFHHNNRSDALVNNKELAKPEREDDDKAHLNPKILINTTTTMTTTTRSVQYNTSNYPIHHHPQQQQQQQHHFINGGTRLGRDRGDSITSDGYYSRNNSPIISYAKSDDGTQTEVEKESVHIQVPYLASEGVQTEPLVAEPEVIPTRAHAIAAAAKAKQQKETRPRRKQFVDYVCDFLVFLQDCCTCNGVGGVL